MSEENPSTDRLVEEIYERLSSFRVASEQLAENAIQTSATSESWKTLTVSFSKIVEDTREGIESVVNASKSALEISKASQVDLKALSSELLDIKMAKRLEMLEQDQKEILKHVIELRTRHLEMITSMQEMIQQHFNRQKRVENQIVLSIALVFVTVIVIGLKLFDVL